MKEPTHGIDVQQLARLEAAVQSVRRTLRWHTALLGGLLTVVLLWTAFSIWMTVLANAAVRDVPVAERPAAAPAEPPEHYQGFSDWPLARQVAEASVVVLTAPQGSGAKRRMVIQEVLKQAPGTLFGYRVGDGYDPWGDVRKRSDLPPVQGGMLTFLVDSPARPVYATSYALEDRQACNVGRSACLEQLRALVRSGAAPRAGN